MPPATLGHHWFCARQWSRAFGAFLQAAKAAQALFAHTEALALYDQAAACTQAHWRPGPNQMAALRDGRAQVLMGLNRFSEAAQDLAWLADRALQKGDLQAHGQALSRLATAHFWSHNLDQARAVSEQALQLAEETGDQITATMCTSNLGCIALCTGDLLEGARQLEAVLQRSRQFKKPEMLVEALACLPGAYHWQGDSARALPLLEEGIAIARREGLGFWMGNLLFFAGLCHGSLGHYPLALQLFQEAEAYSREANDPFTQMRVANCLGWVYHELHDLDRALQRNQESAAMAQVFPWPEPLANALVNLAFDHLQRGELAQCQARLQAAQDLLEKDEWMRWRWHTRLLLASGALSLRRADLDDAREAFLQAQSLAAKTGARKNMARACLWLGRLALATGEAEDAQRTLARAAELAAAVHNPRLGWLSLEALGDAQQRMDDPEGARRAWKAAAELLMHTAAELPDHPLRRSFLASPRAAAILAKAQNPS